MTLRLRTSAILAAVAALLVALSCVPARAAGSGENAGAAAGDASGANGDGATAAPAGSALLSPARFPQLTEAVDARVGLDRRLGADTGGSGLASSCVAVGLPSGEMLFGLHDDASLIPASTTKLFTGLAALLAVGADTRFRTEVWEKDGTLYLKGGGDPVLATPQWARSHPDEASTSLAELASSAVAAHPGAGAVVADAGVIDTDPAVEGWESRYLRDFTAPRISGLAVDRGRPDPDPNRPKVANGQADADLAAAAAFAGLYGGAGVTVSRGATPEGATLVASVESPPLSEIVAAMEKNSDNFIAEVLLRHVGRSAGDPTTAGGVRAEAAVLGGLGIDLSGVHLLDGSGLHRDSKVTCEAMLGLLQAGLSDASVGAVFAKSLAVGGTDGTLKKRHLAGDVRAKTGTLNDVSNLVGAAGSGDGDLYFAILMNGTAGSDRAHQIQERIVADIGRWPAP